ncbi:MAG: gliding motility-associated C-terminal domain-containing protein, partial [Bacteroidales bacterium]|nr:gliding motility-associated C-terminal domain-containing protein [Bacteroidales bacterium]
TITADHNPVCAGTVVTFTAAPVNGGTNPAYAWYVNGVQVSGQTGNTYQYIPVNGDQVTAKLLSSEECAVNNPATSNTIGMVVNALLPVSLVIEADQNPVCEGTTVTFTATPTNGGTNPAYQWFVNGVEVPGQTSQAYAYIPANGDVVHATVNSSEPCATDNPASSNPVTMVILPEMEVSVTIDADQNPVCEGTEVNFSATPVSGGLNPVYTWFVNSTQVMGVTGNTYTYAPADGDQVYATLLSDAACATNNPAISNTVVMGVTELVPVEVVIMVDHNPVCEGTPVLFTAVPTNGGTNPVYAWFVNGIEITGQTTSTFTFVPANGDIIHTTVLSDVTCATNNPAISNPIMLEVTTKLVPSFAMVGPLAQCTIAPDLPPVSLNNITGTWTPSAITTGTAGTFTFTFTPDEGQCATVTTMDIVITKDAEPPAITCDDMYAEASAANCSMYVDIPLPVVSDNCGVKTITNNFTGSANASGYYPLGVTSVIWTVEDVNGNISTCHSPVTVVSTVVANDDYASTLSNVPVNIFILGNDLYCVGSNNPIAVVVIEEPEHGLYFQSGDIRFLDYAPDFGFNGIDSLKYELCDYTGACDTATVYIIVEYFNKRPVAVDDLDSTIVNIPVVIDVLANDYDPDGRIVNYEILAQPQHGASIKIMIDSTILYSPFNDYIGSDEFMYYIYDDGNPSLKDTATVRIDVFKKDILPEPPFIIYNALTPNGDGVNDYWKIKGIELYPTNRVVIMDRWGAIVAEIEHYDNGDNRWEGLDKEGNMVPNGTYYYFLTVSEYPAMYKGWVFLYRD